jgi:hypothetical protein
MLREIRGRNKSRDLDSYGFSKLIMNLRKGDSMEIVKYLHDLAAVLVFWGIALSPRAIVTYFALRGKQ